MPGAAKPPGGKKGSLNPTIRGLVLSFFLEICKSKTSNHCEYSLVLEDAEGPVTLEKVQGLFPCFLLGRWELVSPHGTELHCLVAPGPLEGYLHHISSICFFGKLNRAIGHKAGALPHLLQKLCRGAKEILSFLSQGYEDSKNKLSKSMLRGLKRR